MPILTLVVAVADNGVIGRGGTLPWKLPADLAHFKAVTLGHPILMGRKTYESIGRALPGRRNMVITRGQGAVATGIETYASLDAAIAAGSDEPELMIIGGAEIYRLALPRADRIQLTQVHAAVAGDTLFPELSAEQWSEQSRVERPADEKNSHALSFIVLERRPASKPDAVRP